MGDNCFWSLEIGGRVDGGGLGTAEADITSCPRDAGAGTEPEVAGGGFGPVEADTTSWPTDVGARLELRWEGTLFCPPGVDSGARMGRGDARASFGPSEEGGIVVCGPAGARANFGSVGTGAAFFFAGSLEGVPVGETPCGPGKGLNRAPVPGLLLPVLLWPSMSAAPNSPGSLGLWLQLLRSREPVMSSAVSTC